MTTTIKELKALPQWVGHRTKIPMNPHTGKAASSNDPSTWANASIAWTAKNRYAWDGIGFVFTIESGIVGIDIDNCMVDGKPNAEAQQVIDCLNSYTELSPSGNGLHILVEGTIPNSLKNERIEIYNELRYFTMTGNEYESTGYIAPRQDELSLLWHTFGGDYNERKIQTPTNYTPTNTSESDVKSALSALPNTGDYNSYWLPILMAVHDAFPNETGISLIESWSPGYEGEVRRKFRSFDKTSKSGIGVGSLFHMAKERGWSHPNIKTAQKKAKKDPNDLRDMIRGMK